MTYIYSNYFFHFITSFSYQSVIHSESRRKFPRHEALPRRIHQIVSYNSRITNTGATAQSAEKKTREGASDRVGLAAGTLRHNLLLHFPNVHWREDAPATPSSSGDPTAWTCGMPLRPPSGDVVLTLMLRRPPTPAPAPRPCVWSCIFSLSAIAFICGGKRPMLHGHLHTLVNIGVEGFYIIAGSFEKDRRKGYISLWECAAAFYVVIRE